MSVKLRLRRMGKKKQPIYKVVAADVRSPRDGKFLEAVGLYNPLTNPHTVEFKEDRVMYWLDNGAQPTNTVKSLLSEKGIILKKELKKKGLDEGKVNAHLEEWQKLKEVGKKIKTGKPKSKRKTQSKSEEKAGVDSKETEIKAEEKTPAKSEEQKEAITEEGTAEVKGAASEEKETEKE